MRQKYLFFIILLSCSYIKAQTFTGKVIDAESKQPIKYASIGIVGKNLGTVSDESGNFTIDLPAQHDKDTLMVSLIGYNSLNLEVTEFKKEYLLKKKQIELNKKMISLSKIIIIPNNSTNGVVGNKSKRSTAASFSTHLGSEIGTVMKIRKTPAFIQNVNFGIASNKFDSIIFRVNIYKMENGLPGASILNEPIFVTTKMKKGILSVDLENYNLYVEDNFFLSLEWIQDLGEKPLAFYCNLTGQRSYSRIASQGTWEKLPLVGLGFYATVLYEK